MVLQAPKEKKTEKLGFHEMLQQQCFMTDENRVT
jgi:hypothetical protein